MADVARSSLVYGSIDDTQQRLIGLSESLLLFQSTYRISRIDERRALRSARSPVTNYRQRRCVLVSTNSQVEHDVRRMNAEWVAALVQRDTATLARIMAADCMPSAMAAGNW